MIVGGLVERKSGSNLTLVRSLLVYAARQYDKNTPAVLPITIDYGRSKWRLEKSCHAIENTQLFCNCTSVNYNLADRTSIADDVFRSEIDARQTTRRGEYLETYHYRFGTNLGYEKRHIEC